MSTRTQHLDISVLIATHNRANVLAQTLENLARLDRSDISAEFVVIDNNSTDATRATVELWQDRLPVRYLHETRQGKNHALNKAIAEVPLGELVAFTDDDVNPATDWLHAMIAAAQRHEEYSVFGGAIRVELPPGAPAWALSPRVQTMTYARHDLGDVEKPYARGKAYPCGANLWVRGSLFDHGLRFDATLGPRPKNRYMGSETSFLRELAAAGHDMLYVPSAVVGHCIQPDALSPAYVRQRAWRQGKSLPHAWGVVPHAALHRRHRWLWTCLRIALLVRWVLRYLLALCAGPTRRVERSIAPVLGIAAELECLRVARRGTEEMRAMRECADTPSA